MLTDNQKDLVRLMQYHTQAKPDVTKAQGLLADDDILAILNSWIATKKASPMTQQGLVAEIVTLGG